MTVTDNTLTELFKLEQFYLTIAAIRYRCIYIALLRLGGGLSKHSTIKFLAAFEVVLLFPNQISLHAF